MLCAADAQIWQRAVIQGFRACDAFMCGLLRGSHWGGFIAVRVVPVCEVEVGSAWSRRSWRATFRATKRLAIAENIYKSQRDSSLGLFAVCGTHRGPWATPQQSCPAASHGVVVCLHQECFCVAWRVRCVRCGLTHRLTRAHMRRMVGPVVGSSFMLRRCYLQLARAPAAPLPSQSLPFPFFPPPRR